MTEPIALNLSQAAELLGLSRPTVRTLIHRDDFPAMKIGSRWVISRSGLEAWIAQKSAARAELDGVRR
jgi:excisionase family DNA binding protein